MKKTIVLISVFLLTTFFYDLLAQPAGGPISRHQPVTTLILDANIRVVLVNNENAILQVDGSDRLKDLVIFNKTGDTLTISSARNKNLKRSGVVYVPASQLRNIRINSEADISSLFALKIPKLDVVINGACTLAIANIGEMRITETAPYSIEQTIKISHFPAGIL